jgi:hypothetical protein
MISLLWTALPLCLALTSFNHQGMSFHLHPSIVRPGVSRKSQIAIDQSKINNNHFQIITNGGRSSSSTLSMATGSDDDGPGLGTRIVAGLLLVIFVAGSLLPPLLSPMSGGGSRDLSIADSVVTTTGNKPTMESPSDRLSRATIQEKLNSIPVFYITSSGTLSTTDFYTSYEDAKEVAASKGMDSTVKATTLDQVL